MVRWWLTLAVAVVIAGVAGLLRFREERSAGEAQLGPTAIREIESLQQLRSRSPARRRPPTSRARVVARARDPVGERRRARARRRRGARDPRRRIGCRRQLRRDGDQLELSRRSLMTEAARGDGRVGRGSGDARRRVPRRRASCRRARQAVMAFPLRAQAHVIGSIGFLFDRATPLDGDTQALARIVADLAAQALERARLYEPERESRARSTASCGWLRASSRRRLEIDGGDLCREARTTFGADYGVLWRIRDERLELLAVDPPRPDLFGSRLGLDDFPRLRGAIEGLGASFVADVLETTLRGGARIRPRARDPLVAPDAGRHRRVERARPRRSRGSRSSPSPTGDARGRPALRRPGGPRPRADRAPSRRGRRRATRGRDATAPGGHRGALAGDDRLDVSNTCLEHALESVGAEAGFVVLSGPERCTVVEIVSSSGYDDDELAAWRALRSRLRRALRPGDRAGRARLGALGRRDVGVHRPARGPRARVGHHSARDEPRRSRRAAPLAPATTRAQRGRARVAPGDGLAVRSGARAKRISTRRSSTHACVAERLQRIDGRSLSNALTPADVAQRRRRRGRRRGRRVGSRARGSPGRRVSAAACTQRRDGDEVAAAAIERAARSTRSWAMRVLRRASPSFSTEAGEPRLACRRSTCGTVGPDDALPRAARPGTSRERAAGRDLGQPGVASDGRSRDRRGARGSGRAGTRAGARLRVRADDRGDPAAERAAPVAPARRGRPARRPLPARHGAAATSAATGSTRSSSPTESSASSSATSSARACRRPRAWRSCGTRSARSRSTA